VTGARSAADADVVVVGAGPGGTAAAIAAAARGLRVILLDPGPGRAPAPGETLHPGVQPVLEALGVGEAMRRRGFVRHRGLWVTWGGPSRFVRYGGDARGPWRGYQAWRPDFDRLLAGRAAALGVRFVRGRARASLHASGRVGGVSTHEGDMTARFTLDAGGRGAWLGRHLRLARPACSAPLLARYGYRRGRCRDADAAPRLEAGAEGWTWTARVRPGLYAWVRLTFGRARATSEVPARLAGLAPVGRTRGADVTWRLTPACAGPGYFLVGDAAAVLDPVSSHGVLRALMSGLAAGTRAAAVVAGRLTEAEAAAGYRRWLIAWFTSDAHRLAEVYDRITTHHRLDDRVAGAMSRRFNTAP
jgi:flavin-dependent dehydrogenase